VGDANLQRTGRPAGVRRTLADSIDPEERLDQLAEDPELVTHLGAILEGAAQDEAALERGVQVVGQGVDADIDVRTSTPHGGDMAGICTAALIG
jgi:hypothetical protein